MSRTVNGIEPTPAAILGRRPAPALPKLSRTPWATIVSASGMALGLALLIGSRPSADVPLALASPAPAPAPAVLEVESRVAELAARVRVLEAEVAELRSPVVHAGRRVVHRED